jgi:hypothetical protein
MVRYLTMGRWVIIILFSVLPVCEPQLAAADDLHPSFLEAAVFFMTGREPPHDVELRSEKLAVVRNRFYPEQGDPEQGQARDARCEYSILDTEPCTIYVFMLDPPYGAERLEFMKLPSPRAMKMFNDDAFQMDIPHETWCKSKAEVNSKGVVERIKGTSMCSRGKILGGEKFRRLAALDYIRANFCPGQPEPPPPPRKPY